MCREVELCLGVGERRWGMSNWNSVCLGGRSFRGGMGFRKDRVEDG